MEPLQFPTKFRSPSEGIWRRFVPLPCEATVAPQDQDRALAKKLCEELPGILNWALKGLKSLRARGFFDVPNRSKKLLAEHRGASNPELLFFEEECKARQGAEIQVDDLYGRYSEWCRVGGHKAMSKGELGKALRRRYPQIERKRRRRGGKVPWVYTGVECSYCSYVPLLNVNSAGESRKESEK